MLISVIIPTYNEKENVQVLVPQLVEVFSKHGIDGRVIVVDDSSPDGTGKVAEALAEKLDKISVLNRSGKLGIGSAYKDGFRYALSLGCNGVITMDADLSHDPSSIPEFVRKLEEGCDLVVGSRYIPGGSIPNWTYGRRLVSRGANRFARLLLGLHVHDATSGYRAYNSRALNKIDVSAVKSDGYAFQVEMTMRCEQAGLKVCETPITFVDRCLGESKLGKRDIWNFFKAVLRLAFE